MSEDDDDNVLEGVCALLVLLLTPAFLVYSGFTLKTLWAWFIVPLGVPPLTLVQAIGIGIMVAFLMARARRREHLPKASTMLMFELLQPGLTLLIAWLVLRIAG